MHRSVSILGLLAHTVALTAAQGQPSLLGNGGLEQPAVTSDSAVGWVLTEPSVDANGLPVSSATFSTIVSNHTPGGDRSLWLQSYQGGFGPTNPPTVEAHLHQDVPALAGGEYTLSGWFRLEPNYSGINPAEPTRTLLALDFRNGGGTITTDEIDIDTVYDTSAGGIDTWQRFEIVAVAPPGTTSVRVRISMIDGVTQPANPQSALVDDLELVGPPGAVVVVPTLSSLGSWLFAIVLVVMATGALRARAGFP